MLLLSKDGLPMIKGASPLGSEGSPSYCVGFKGCALAYGIPVVHTGVSVIYLFIVLSQNNFYNAVEAFGKN